MLAAEATRDISEAPERILIDATLEFMDSRPNAGVAIRQLVCLGYCINNDLMNLGVDWEIVAVACGRASLTIDQALAIIATSSLQSLSKQAIHDVLTGLFNRRAWDDDLKRIFDQARAAESIFSIVSIDLDGLKRVNDSDGHEAGDALIRQMATALQSGARPSDMLYRWGGDEFWLIMPDCSVSTARETIERIATDGPEFSYGIAVYPEDGDDLEVLTACADGRMYDRKHEKKAAHASGTDVVPVTPTAIQ
jgi:diguanylate cyclase (GGDEF)-like protein